MLNFILVLVATRIMELGHFNNRLACLRFLRRSALTAAFCLLLLLVALFAVTDKNALEHMFVLFLLKHLVKIQSLNRTLTFLDGVHKD